MARYLRHFIAGIHADVRHLVTVDFQSLDPQALHNLFDAVMILKIAQKTLPSYVWQQCGAYRNGLINYKRMNTYLESYMGTRQKAELALRRQWSLEEKKKTLFEHVEPPSLVKKKEPLVISRELPMPIVAGLQPFASSVPA